MGNPPPGNITQFFDGLVTITDPQLFSDNSAKIRASIIGSVIAATGEHSEVTGSLQDPNDPVTARGVVSLMAW